MSVFQLTLFVLYSVIYTTKVNTSHVFLRFKQVYKLQFRGTFFCAPHRRSYDCYMIKDQT